ncbi:MAG: hypothetical protein ACYSSO_13030 [Planctomycetota bacterium]|jgi:hypothetical protein
MAHWNQLEITSGLINTRWSAELIKNNVTDVEVIWRAGIDSSSRWQIILKSAGDRQNVTFKFGEIYACCGAALAYVASVEYWESFDKDFLISLIEWCGHKCRLGSVYIVVMGGNKAYAGLRDRNKEERKGWTFVKSTMNPRSGNMLHHWVGAVSEFITKL